MADENDILDIIIGRVDPYIYAFRTNQVPDSLKVGDTNRGVKTRLEEWALHYPNLEAVYQHVASLPEYHVYFRDYAVHQFLENEKKRVRVQRDKFAEGTYYSREFFNDATVDDLHEAIDDIVNDARAKRKYQFYNDEGLPVIPSYKRADKPFEIRRLQQTVIDNFVDAVNNGRDNLLMYAVMRFGKSFTALCCAQAIKARFVAIVSAKGDVKDEWQQNVQVPKQFEHFVFLTQRNLRNDGHAIRSVVEKGDVAVLFLTLQDLQGKDIKEKHSEVFKCAPDLLIVDETHFGARAESFGNVLKKEGKANLDDKSKPETIKDDDLKTIKQFNAKVRMHLSGTPYNIMLTNEFSHDDIIAFCQYTDILDAKKQWYREHTEKEEWENPYYGFPQMIRFAFHPNKSARRLLENLKENGETYSFPELFATVSTRQDEVERKHQLFAHPDEVLELLQAIDGSKRDENILAFLDNERIKRGLMCRHVVCVLPYRSSCDAMACMLNENKASFYNLCDYHVINIAGHDTPYNDINKVKTAIADFEKQNIKTISLTVNKMLTGCTVPQWDTMLFLKGTSSAQEYDQATFRIQSQYVKTFDDGKGNILKRDMKPQTLLVDFDPLRMFRMQERRAFFTMLFNGGKGQDEVERRIREEMSVSPIISMNANLLKEVRPQDVMESVMEYSRMRSAQQEALELPVDYDLLEDPEILSAVESQKEISAKNGWADTPHSMDGAGDDMENPYGKQGSGGNDKQPHNKPDDTKGKKNDKELSIEKQFATLYVRALFFAYLTESDVTSLSSLLQQATATDDNRRIAHNIGMPLDVFCKIANKMDAIKLRSLDHSIQLINRQMKDENIPLAERVSNATRKFGRMSESEIVTPANIAREMVDLLPGNIFDDDKCPKFLDIASKQGEFAYALAERFGGQVKENVYSIVTSPLAYEFTRKIYTLLGMPVSNIFTRFNTYDLIGERKETIIKELRDMKFNIVLGNPPYQENNGGGKNSSSGASIYPEFVLHGQKLQPDYLSIIIPSRWYSGNSKYASDFRAQMSNGHHIIDIHDYPNGNEVFGNVDIKGGVCHFLWCSKYTGHSNFIVHSNRKIADKSRRKLLSPELNAVVRYSTHYNILLKVKRKTSRFFSEIVCANDPFAFDKRQEGSMRRKKIDMRPKSFDGSVEIYYNGWRKNGVKYISREEIHRNRDWVDRFKILIPKAWGVGNITNDRIKPFVVDKNTCCTETYLVVSPTDSVEILTNICKYMESKFFHTMVFGIKNTQNSMQNDYSLVPLQNFTPSSDIDWSKSVAEIDQQLYAKYGLTNEEITFIESMIKPM